MISKDTNNRWKGDLLTCSCYGTPSACLPPACLSFFRQTAKVTSALLPFRHGRMGKSVPQRRILCRTGVARGSRSSSTSMSPPAPHMPVNSFGGEKKTVISADHICGNRCSSSPGNAGLAARSPGTATSLRVAIGGVKRDWSSSCAVQAAAAATSRAGGRVSSYGRSGNDNDTGNNIEDSNSVCSSLGAPAAAAAAAAATTNAAPPRQLFPSFSWPPSSTLSCGHPIDYLRARATTPSRHGVGETTEATRQASCTGPRPVHLSSFKPSRQHERGVQATPAMWRSVYEHRPSPAPHVSSESPGGGPFGASGAIDTTTAAAGTLHAPAGALDISTAAKGEATVHRGDQRLRSATIYGVWGAPDRFLIGGNSKCSASATASCADDVTACFPTRASGVHGVTSVFPAGAAGAAAAGAGAAVDAAIGESAHAVGEAHSLANRVPPATFFIEGVDDASHAIASPSCRRGSEAPSTGGGDHPLSSTVCIGADPWGIGVSGSRNYWHVNSGGRQCLSTTSLERRALQKKKEQQLPHCVR